MDLNAVVTPNPTVLTFIVSVLLPMVVALVTRKFSDGSVKALTLLFLSIISGWATELAASGGSFELKSTVINIVVTFGLAVLAHFGLWKPVNITGDAGAIMKAVPGGIGSPTS